MRELGRRGAKARMLKLGKRERKKIARRIAAIERSKRGTAQAQTLRQPPKRAFGDFIAFLQR